MDGVVDEDYDNYDDCEGYCCEDEDHHHAEDDVAKCDIHIEGYDEREMREILTGCRGPIANAKLPFIHKICRRIDAHEQLWVPFARCLLLPDKCVAQVKLMAMGGGSPARLFLSIFALDQPHIQVCQFMDLLAAQDMVEVVRVFDLVEPDTLAGRRGSRSRCTWTSPRRRHDGSAWQRGRAS